MKTFYRVSTLVMVLLSCIVVALFYVLTTRNIEQVYLDHTREAIHSIKRDFIHDTVNNLIQRIDGRREAELAKYDRAVVEFEQLFAHLDPLMEKQELIKLFIRTFDQRTALGAWNAYLWDHETKEVLFDRERDLAEQDDIEAFLRQEEPSFAVKGRFSAGSIEGFFGVRQQTIDEQVKRAVADDIHASRFAEDSYIWVNEVVNYDGGDNYAIRRVHPNLVNTEGIYLSTSMTDIAGDFPYLEELKGIKMYGELYFTYNFKKKNSDEISEKLSYAKLYKPFDWIIAMGIHLDDMEAIGLGANEKSGAVASRNLPWFLGLLVLVVALGSALLIMLERMKARREQRALEEQANIDVLTRVYNRRFGMQDLAQRFARYKQTGRPESVIFTFDIDNFKHINDTFGHTVGDKALQLIAQTITSQVRNTDRLYRWGGDEFILVCDGMELVHLEPFASKLLASIRKIGHERDDCPCTELTISMGISPFHEQDGSHLEVLERADQALYRAKRSGKDRFEILL